MQVPLALAEARLGDHASAITRVERCIAEREALGCNGLNLGWTYEARARIAIAMHDHAGYQAAAARCAAAYGHGRSGSLLAVKFEALRTEARQAGFESPPGRPTLRPGQGGRSQIGTALSRAFSLEGASFAERCQSALTLLVAAAEAESGALYRYHEDGLQLCADSGPLAEPDMLSALAVRALSELAMEDEFVTVTLTEGADNAQPEQTQWTTAIFGTRVNDAFAPSGVAVLGSAASSPASAHALAEAIGKLLAQEA